MALARLEMKVIGRSRGKSATGAAAYRSASRLTDARSGMVHDYRRRAGVLHREIALPDGSFPALADRETLWNRVEAAETRKDARVARELVLALPHELEHDERVALVQGFVAENITARGLVADIAVHAPDRKGDHRNHHAHVLFPERAATPEGLARTKDRSLTEVAWLEGLRDSFEEHANRALERAGIEARVSLKSLEERGLDREPEPKMGPLATDLERKGRSTKAGDDRRAVHERNQTRAAREAEIARLEAAIVLERQRAAELAQAREAARVPDPAPDLEATRRAAQIAALSDLFNAAARPTGATRATDLPEMRPAPRTVPQPDAARPEPTRPEAPSPEPPRVVPAPAPVPQTPRITLDPPAPVFIPPPPGSFKATQPTPEPAGRTRGEPDRPTVTPDRATTPDPVPEAPAAGAPAPQTPAATPPPGKGEMEALIARQHRQADQERRERDKADAAALARAQAEAAQAFELERRALEKRQAARAAQEAEEEKRRSAGTWARFKGVLREGWSALSSWKNPEEQAKKADRERMDEARIVRAARDQKERDAFERQRREAIDRAAAETRRQQETERQRAEAERARREDQERRELARRLREHEQARRLKEQITRMARSAGRSTGRDRDITQEPDPSPPRAPRGRSR